MKILVLNCGSSSIKYALYNMDDKSVMTSGGAERVGLDGAFVKVKLANGEKKQVMHDIPEHTEGVKFIFSLLTDPEIGVNYFRVKTECKIYTVLKVFDDFIILTSLLWDWYHLTCSS